MFSEFSKYFLELTPGLDEGNDPDGKSRREARCGNDGGFLPGFIHTKGRSWVSSYLPSWILSLPKKTKTMRGTSTLNEL